MGKNITELLNITYPVIQGGMAWVAEYHLAAAVSEAGGLGIIAAGAAPAEWVREQIRKVKEITDKPFGVNIMLMNPEADDVARILVEEGVKVVTTGAGNPEKYMAMWKEAGMKVIPVVASVALAKRMERCGADAVISLKNVSREALNISEDELMERFVRGDSARTSEGSGLGLSIARSLTELQGGSFAITIDCDLFKAELRFRAVEMPNTTA